MNRSRSWSEKALPISSHVWAPATIKISMKNAQELEIKVSYMSGPVVAEEQQYIVNVYGFVPEQLTASEIKIYPHLAQVMRLHTPRVALDALAEDNGGGYLPADLIRDLHDQYFAGACNTTCSSSDIKKAEAAKTAALAAANQTFRLYGCVFRTSLRKQLKDLVAECRAAQEAKTSVNATETNSGATAEPQQQLPPPQWSLVGRHLTAFTLGILGVITRFEKEAGAPALSNLPESFREAVNLVDEFLMFESIRALVKLLGGIDKALKKSSNDGTADGCCVSSRKGATQEETAADDVIAARPGLDRCHHRCEPLCPEQPGGYDMATARELVGDTIANLEAHLQSGGMAGSVLDPVDEYGNESFTYRQRVLKRHVRSGVSVSLSSSTPSFWFADLIGALVSAVAMILAVLSIVLAQVVTGSTKYTVIFGIILVVGYVIKDRLKEWGKRYLEDFGRLLHVRFPDRIRYLRGHQGKVVGRCDEKAAIICSSSVPKVVAGVRHANKGPLGGDHPVVQQERVIHYSKRVKLWWQRLAVSPCVTARQEGLDDVMVFDLSFLMKHMQPARKTLARVWRAEEGRFGVEAVVCSRVYHLHFIAAVKALAAGADDRSMALRHVKVIMDRNGIKRLEKDDTWVAQKPLGPITRAATRFSTGTVGTALKKLGSQQMLAKSSSGGVSTATSAFDVTSAVDAAAVDTKESNGGNSPTALASSTRPGASTPWAEPRQAQTHKSNLSPAGSMTRPGADLHQANT